MKYQHERHWMLFGGVALALASWFGGCADGTTQEQEPPKDGGHGTDAPGMTGTTGDGSRPVDCTAPLVSCGGACADLQTDVANCGACHAACTGTMTCQAGGCILSLDGGAVPEGGSGGDGGFGFDGGFGDGGFGFDGGFGDGGFDFDGFSFDGGGFDGGLGFDAAAFTCSHSPCVLGVALVNGCDDSPDYTVSTICNGDQPQCCTTGWVQTCVDEATMLCHEGHDHVCFDPGC